MTDQFDEESPTGDGSSEAWAGGAIRDERDRVADHRDRDADERDRVADSRDRIAQTRDSIADDRDARADDRDSHGGAVDQDLSSTLRRAHAVQRDDAAKQRAATAQRRNDATARRDAEAMQRRARTEDEINALGAHLALNSSAIVVAGIESLKMRWSEMEPADWTALMDAIHANATSLDEALRRMIRGQAE